MHQVKLISLALLLTLFACSDNHDSPAAIEPMPEPVPPVEAGFLLSADADLITAWAPQQWRSQVPEGI